MRFGALAKDVNVRASAGVRQTDRKQVKVGDRALSAER
jgi:hypothetical protein